MLTVNLEAVGELVILRCRGRIVRGDETPILCTAVQQYGWNVVLDLSGVEAIDAAGIGALVSLQAAGVYVRLMNPTKQVREILALTKLDSILEICEPESLDEMSGQPEPNRSEVSLQAGVSQIESCFLPSRFSAG